MKQSIAEALSIQTNHVPQHHQVHVRYIAPVRVAHLLTTYVQYYMSYKRIYDPSGRDWYPAAEQYWPWSEPVLAFEGTVSLSLLWVSCLATQPLSQSLLDK